MNSCAILAEWRAAIVVLPDEGGELSNGEILYSCKDLIREYLKGPDEVTQSVPDTQAGDREPEGR